MALAQRQRQQQQEEEQRQRQAEAFYVEDLFSPISKPIEQPLFEELNPVQKVISMLQQNSNQPVGAALSQISFPPVPEHLISLIDNLQKYPQLALQALIWSLRQPNFQYSPLLGSRIAPILPAPKPPSVDRFLADTYAFWMQPDAPLPAAIVEPLLSLYCYAAFAFDEILEIFHSMREKGLTPTVNHFNQVMQAAVSKQHNQTDKAQLLFKHMVKNGPPPNATSYNILIYGLGEAGDSAEALRLFEEMVANDFSVNEATYSSLISSIIRTGELEKALWLMQQMRYNGVKPSQVTYILVLQELCRKGKHQYAASVLNDMQAEDMSVDADTHQMLITSLSKALGVEESEAFRMLFTQKQQPGI
ncbi:hypothetical protein KP509_12G030200 [Ceratopteris richardii]|nr:hypothetical protein KP509_12G030200 [Ceratopteris richardii]